jgi:hypothetical protein
MIELLLRRGVHRAFRQRRALAGRWRVMRLRGAAGEDDGE